MDVPRDNEKEASDWLVKLFREKVRIKNFL